MSLASFVRAREVVDGESASTTASFCCKRRSGELWANGNHRKEEEEKGRTKREEGEKKRKGKETEKEREPQTVRRGTLPSPRQPGDTPSTVLRFGVWVSPLLFPLRPSLFPTTARQFVSSFPVRSARQRQGLPLDESHPPPLPSTSMDGVPAHLLASLKWTDLKGNRSDAHGQPAAAPAGATAEATCAADPSGRHTHAGAIENL